MKQFLTRKAMIVVGTGLALVACGGGGGDTAQAPAAVTPGATAASVFATEEAVAVRDASAVYAVEEGRVLKASIVTTDGAYTFADVNADTDDSDAIVPEIDAHLVMDGYADDGKTKNASIRLRGHSSRLAPQKSYRVKLSQNIPLWRGESTLQFNKHPWDLTRVRNKLAFDLFRDIPHISSLRTQFVQLAIQNKNTSGVEYASADFGLFTHVEKMGKEYLANRGLSTDGNIYKAEDFQFLLHANLKINEKGEVDNKTNFEKTLSLEADNKNHKKLIEMLTALNDDQTDFNVFFSKYFDKSNYLTWLATSVLMGNRDTVNQNFALYQAAGSDKFYLLPWDYDGAFGFEDQPDIKAEQNLYSKWQLSASNWWGVPLHRRFMSDPQHLAELKLAVDEIYAKYLGSDKIKAKLDSYKPLVSPFLARDPDLAHLPTVSAGKAKEWDDEYARIAGIVKNNRDVFISALESPMPFYQGVELLNGQMLLTWDTAVDLQGDLVTYTIQISNTPDFSVLQTNVSTKDAQYSIPKLANGIYYLKVSASDSKGNTQVAFDRTDIGSKVYFGVYRFEVKTDSVAGLN
jgi:spore coat protein H